MSPGRTAPWSAWAVVGIDPSLTGTGVAIVRGGVLVHTLVLTTKGSDPHPARLGSLRLQLWDVLMTYTPRVVAMESEVFISGMWSVEQSHVQGVLQLCLWEYLQRTSGNHFLSINPSHVKKWVGARMKNEMLLQVFKQYGQEFRDHNAADALVIAMVADSYLALDAGQHWPEHSRAQKEVLAKLEATQWPWEGPPVKRTKARPRRVSS